ncbi:MAG: response regulator [Parcubacteria group bacterium]|jgi:CheY-like chemotaxis protein
MKTLKILLVDDDDAIRDMYASIFRKNDFIVSEAKDGVEGLASATRDLPDVIFTGIVMPIMDGFAMMEALKKNVATSSIPVVISSHLGRKEDQQRARDLGAKAFFVRGFDTPNKIVEKIRALFEVTEYKLKFAPNELDADILAQNMHIGKDFKCTSCESNLVLVLKTVDIDNHEFLAKFVCSECGVEQN